MGRCRCRCRCRRSATPGSRTALEAGPMSSEAGTESVERPDGYTYEDSRIYGDGPTAIEVGVERVTGRRYLRTALRPRPGAPIRVRPGRRRRGLHDGGSRTSAGHSALAVAADRHLGEAPRGAAVHPHPERGDGDGGRAGIPGRGEDRDHRIPARHHGRARRQRGAGWRTRHRRPHGPGSTPAAPGIGGSYAIATPSCR
jgi:hypothetical protein